MSENTPHIRIHKWDELQHYKDRDPPWIKLYNRLLDHYEYSRLPDASKGQYTGLILLASRRDNEIPLDVDWIANQINATDPLDLRPLVNAGLIDVYHRDSEPLSQDASNLQAFARSREERREEGEKSREEKNMGDGDEAPPPESGPPQWVDGPADNWPSPSRLPKSDSGDLIYPTEFEEVWADRVPRDGKNPKKRGYRQYRSSRRDGISREEAELALDYRRREAERKGDIGDRHVEQFATFFGQDDLWRDYLDNPDPADVHDMSQADRRLAKRRAELEDDDYEAIEVPM